ncbi:MAG: sigma-70 family RNA polymerase sigma factor [bacterium]|nr:sigma-70 family RNA polymerase sigma factor [bacterium]
MPLDNEQALIERCRRGQLDAFEEIFRHYEPLLLRLAGRMLEDREAAEDAVQDAMVKAYRSIGRFRAEATLSTWLYRIVANTCYDRLAKRKREGWVDLENASEPAAGGHAEIRHHLRRALAGLTPKLKTCFVLYAQEGYKQREIAEMLGLQEGTVKAHVFRAKEQLRAAMAPRMKEWAP